MAILRRWCLPALGLLCACSTLDVEQPIALVLEGEWSARDRAMLEEAANVPSNIYAARPEVHLQYVWRTGAQLLQSLSQA